MERKYSCAVTYGVSEIIESLSDSEIEMLRQSGRRVRIIYAKVPKAKTKTGRYW